MFFISRDAQQINDEIKDKELRVISANGEQLGIMSAKEALKIAEDNDLDLVKISPNANPPVCKIMDYGKYVFDQAKREKEQRKNQKIVELKEVQLSMTIEQHDIDIKAKNATKFLLNGDKVKVVLRMFGRQLQNPQMGMPIMEKFASLVSEEGEITSPATVNGRQIIMVISPKIAMLKSILIYCAKKKENF